MTQSRSLVLRPEFRTWQQGGQGGEQQDPSFVRREQAGPETGRQEQGGQPAGGQPQGNPCADPNTLFMLLAMGAVFYFLLIRPQQKQEKARRAMLDAVKQGDKVVTTGGIHGTISSLSEHTVNLRVDSQLKLTIDRQNIARIEGDKPPADPKANGKKG